MSLDAGRHQLPALATLKSIVLETDEMNFRTTKAAVVALLIGACVPGYAADFTYSDWQQASEQWKRGYAYAALSFQTQVARSESAKDMREIKCLS